MTQTWSVINVLVSIALAVVSMGLADNMAEMSPTMNDYAPSSNNKVGPIQAAVNTMYNLEVRKIITKSEPIPTQKVEIESNNIPLLIHFKSQSSKLKVIQSHKGGVGETQKTMSEDEPDILIHEVKKPIFQHVKEIIVPYRKTVQEIRPVQEQMETIVSKGHPRSSHNSYHNRDEIHHEHSREGEKQMGHMNYMKEGERFLNEEEESDRLSYLPPTKKDSNKQPEGNLISFDFEPDPMAKGKFMPHSGASILHQGPHFGNGPPHNHPHNPQHHLGLPKVSKPLRRQLRVEPHSTTSLQRRMLLGPSQFINKRVAKTARRPLKKKWKIFFLH